MYPFKLCCCFFFFICRLVLLLIKFPKSSKSQTINHVLSSSSSFFRKSQKLNTDCIWLNTTKVPYFILSNLFPYSQLYPTFTRGRCQGRRHHRRERPIALQSTDKCVVRTLCLPSYQRRGESYLHRAGLSTLCSASRTKLKTSQSKDLLIKASQDPTYTQSLPAHFNQCGKSRPSSPA